MGSSCPFPFLSYRMFVFLSREDCKRERRSWMREHRILMRELGSSREHCIRMKELRSHMWGSQCSHKGPSYPSPSDGRFCCKHRQMMGLRMKVQGRRNYQLVLRNCLRGHCTQKREQRNQQRELHSSRKELRMTLREHSFEVRNIHRYMNSCTSYPCPCSSSPWYGRFCHRRSYTQTEGLRRQEQ